MTPPCRGDGAVHPVQSCSRCSDVMQGAVATGGEDLGVITPDVERLRIAFTFRMKVLQFAFDGNSNNPYLPANIQGSQWVVYPGTHDNPTSLGWWQQLDEGPDSALPLVWMLQSKRLDGNCWSSAWPPPRSLTLRCRTCCIWMMRPVSTRRARSVATGTGGWCRWMKPLMVRFGLWVACRGLVRR